MIKKYVFGTPFPTNAVVTEMETAKDESRFWKLTIRELLPMPFLKMILYTVWANRFAVSISGAGSM